VLFYALTAADCTYAVDLFPTIEQAEAALQDVVADEPAEIDARRN